MKKVLVIEDDVLFSSILANKLRAADFDVRVTFDGDAAILNLTEYQPDLILLDLLLPLKDGFQVLKEARQNKKTAITPVIVVSNLGGDEDIARAKKIGISEYLVKATASPDDVIAKVRECLESKTL